jgi:hypothetical protein
MEKKFPLLLKYPGFNGAPSHGRHCHSTLLLAVNP